MANLKLTKEIRRGICEAILNHRFDAARAVLLEDAVRFCREHAVKYQIVGDYPEGWFQKRDKFYLQVEDLPGRLDETWVHGGSKHKLLRGYNWAFRLSEKVRVPYEYSGEVLVVHRGDPSWPGFEALYQRINAHLDERDETRSKLAAILLRFGSAKSLLDAWPELEPFVPKVEEPHLPALPIYEMNKFLGLPVEGREPVTEQ